MYIYTFAGIVFRVTMTTVCVKDPVQSWNKVDNGESYYCKSKPIFTFLTKQIKEGLESRGNWKGNSYKYGSYENIVQSKQYIT